VSCLTAAEKLHVLKQHARKITYEEIIQAGMDALDRTGLDIQDLDRLARKSGLELEDVAYSLGSSHGRRHVYYPVHLDSDAVRLIVELHEVIVKRQAHRLSSLSEMERDLYYAADELEPFSARDLCLRTRTHDLDARSKQCLSNLVKMGLLTKAGGRRGYVRTPTKS